MGVKVELNSALAGEKPAKTKKRKKQRREAINVRRKQRIFAFFTWYLITVPFSRQERFSVRLLLRLSDDEREWLFQLVHWNFFFFFLSFKSTATLHLLELFLSTNSISDGQEKLTPEINEAVFHHPNVDRVHQSISIKRLFQLEVGPELGSNCFKPI